MIEDAVEHYRNGIAVAQKGSQHDSLPALVTRLVALLERAERFNDAAQVYEQVSEFYESRELWFLAADASDHAAELLRKAGVDLSQYDRPAQLWKRNAAYWAGKDKGDEQWSHNRAAAYVQWRDQ